MGIRKTQSDHRIQDLVSVDALHFWENGLLPVVSQDVDTGEVLMVAFANRDALEATLRTGQMHYWSRSRQELWHKGATSGNFQEMISLHADCDGDTVLARVRPRGPACHTGEATCFGALLSAGAGEDSGGAGDAGEAENLEPEDTLPTLWALLKSRAVERPLGSYTVRLLEDENLRIKKLGEEAAELITALARGETDRAVEEAADLTYHLLAALLGAGASLDDLLETLDRRRP